MRILCAIGGMYGGGSERQMLHLLQNLDRDRYQPELYVVTAGGELSGQVPGDVPVHVYSERVRETRSLIPGAGFRRRARDLAQLLRERAFALVYDRTYHMSLITAAATRITPVPRISTIVSDPRSDFATNPERFRWIKRRLLHRAYSDADVTATVSAGVKGAAADYHHLTLEQIEIFHNSYDVQSILQRAAPAELPAQCRRRPGVLRIVTAGRLHTAKAHEVLIEAFRLLKQDATLPPLELMIVGNGPEEDALKRQVVIAQLTGDVIFTGFFDNPLPVVASADLFCLSSRYEGLPNALLEAMICGVPVVATDCPHGPREILDEGRWGALVPPEDPPALAAALAGGIRHLEPFRQRAAKAQAFISDRYSLERGMRRFDELAALAQKRFAEHQHG